MSIIYTLVVPILGIICLGLALNYFEIHYFLGKEASFLKKALYVFGNSALLGIITAFIGFLMGAGIGDESAGEAAVWLFMVGLGIGFGIGALISIVWIFFIA